MQQQPAAHAEHEAGADDASPDQLTPAEEGSGGAQTPVGGRVSDRLSGGEPVPDGPPSDEDSDT